MQKRKKLEQIILVLLIPVFIFSLLYTSIKKKALSAKGSGTMGPGAGLEKEYLEDKAIDTIPKPAGVLEARFEGDDKDPLKNMLQVHLYKIERQEEAKKPKKSKEAVPLPKLDIDGLVWDTDMPQAIINGKVVRVGDTIEGVKVVSIKKKGITVIHLEETVFIPKK